MLPWSHFRKLFEKKTTLFYTLMSHLLVHQDAFLFFKEFVLRSKQNINHLGGF